MKAKCKCGFEWDYKQRKAGLPRKWTCCPSCRSNVKLVYDAPVALVAQVEPVKQEGVVEVKEATQA